MSDSERDRLSPWYVRLAVYAVLVVIALASIRLIDARVVERMQNEERGTQNDQEVDSASSRGPGALSFRVPRS